MLKQFEVNIHKNALFSKADTLLVAFSGGVDSVVLADLLHKAGYHFELAHCNFQLRGNEANKDTTFCETYANTLQVKLHVQYFDTKTYAAKHKLSIQMAARELRYNWFKSLVQEFGFTYVLTAHHASDNTETLLVNLVRGTGIKGLQGIPEKQNDIIRPLLFATKDDIRAYAVKHSLHYREDSSNQEVKYTRNFIRHEVVPKLKTLNPALEETIYTSVQFFKQSAEIVKAFADIKFKEICKEEHQQLFIDIKLLLNEAQKETLLFEWLYSKDFKHSQIQQLSEVLVSCKQSGKQFSSTSHQLVVDRKYIIVKALQKEHTETSFTIRSFSDIAHLPIQLSFEEILEPTFSNNKQEITIAYSESLFPLTLRKWKQGDKFKPFGMDGFKKLSDFFKDQKLSLFEKEAVWILENKEHIIWIVGYRMDNRCRIGDKDKKLMKITLV
ncbi:MAG: tRNA lysidine(34) synthetase TilS [Bacteroidota bacterium]